MTSAPEHGFVTIEALAATGLSLVLFAVLANLVVFGYARGVVRAALDEGVRAGSRLGGGVTTCETRARGVVDDLLGGSMGDGVRITCGDVGPQLQARAQVLLRGWLPPVPDWSFETTALAHRERAP